MSVFYLDTSAIVKRYFPESGTAWIQALADPGSGNTLLLGELTLAETAAVIAAAVSPLANAMRSCSGSCSTATTNMCCYRTGLQTWVRATRWLVLETVSHAEKRSGFRVLPRRRVVERAFAWLTQCRRLTMDYERLTSGSEAFIYLAMTRLMLRRLAS